MAEIGWRNTTVRWFRRFQVVDAVVSLFIWFSRIGGWILGPLFATVGAIVSGAIGTWGFWQITLGAALGIALAFTTAGVMVHSLKRMFPPGAGLVGGDERGYAILVDPFTGQPTRSNAAGVDSHSTTPRTSDPEVPPPLEEDALRSRLESCEEWRDYDIRTPRTFDKLDEVDLKILLHEVRKLRKVMRAAGEGCFALVEGLRVPLTASQDERNLVVDRYFGEHRYNPTQRLFDRLYDEIDKGSDYRKWLVYYYEAYNELRRTTAQMARFAGVLLSSQPGYDKWRQADKSFLADIREVGSVQEMIDALNQKYHYPLRLDES